MSADLCLFDQLGSTFLIMLSTEGGYSLRDRVVVAHAD